MGETVGSTCCMPVTPFLQKPLHFYHQLHHHPRHHYLRSYTVRLTVQQGAENVKLLEAKTAENVSLVSNELNVESVDPAKMQ